MSSFWSWFIIILTTANILACLWLLLWTTKRQPGEQETTGHVWDGDLQEYNNPLPRWWLWLFVLTVVYSLGYLAIYPGMGRFAGTAKWTQFSQYESEVARAEEVYGDVFAQFDGLSFEELSTDNRAMELAHNLYANNCAICHGSDARGAVGFPNLTDDDWLWGGEPEAILQSILAGRNGLMPPWGDALGQQGVEEVAAYVMTLSGRSAPEDWVTAGEEKFALYCASCHGPDGRGMTALGAPNLTDSIWLYGSSLDDVRLSITQGRANQMPAHEDILGDTKARLLTAYLLSKQADDVAARGQ